MAQKCSNCGSYGEDKCGECSGHGKVSYGGFSSQQCVRCGGSGWVCGKCGKGIGS
jgi:hypothetical protein